MPNANPILSSINSGEFSPRMEARVDFDKYPNAAKMARNLIAYPQGGLTRRPGTRFIKEVKTSADPTKLIPFKFNESTAYMIEHGDLYMRFYKLQANLTTGDVASSITNGTFDSNITNWTDISTGSITDDFTATAANPAVITWGGGSPADHGLSKNDPVVFTGSDLPAGITSGTTYYVGTIPSSTTFQILDAPLGSTITTTDTGSSTQTATAGPEIIHDSANSRLQLTGQSLGVAVAEQQVTNAATTATTIRFTVAGAGGGKVGFQVGTGSGGTQVLSEVMLGAGEHTLTFTPTAADFYIQFRNEAKPVRDMYIDAVSVLDDAPVELTSPYAKTDLSGLRAFQAADVIYLLHSSYTPRKLERRGDKSWSIVDAFFEDGPYLGENPGTDLDDVQILTNPFFEDGLNGWTDDSTSTSYITHDDTDNVMIFNKVSTNNVAARTTATVDVSRPHILHYQVKTTGKVATTTVEVNLGTSAGSSAYSATDLNSGWNTIGFTPSSSTTLHVEFQYNDNPRLAGMEIGAVLLYDSSANFIKASATKGLVTLTAAGHTPFASADVGRLVRLEWPGRETGYCVITKFASSTSVTALVLRDFASTEYTEGWKFGAWGGDQGNPQTIGFFDGRLVAARTTEKPNSLWFSQTNDLQNMRLDSFVSGSTVVEDDDAIDITLAGKEINPIFWVSGQVNLVLGTAGGQWVIDSSSDTITPGGIRARQHSYITSADIPATNVNNITLFADKSERELYDIVFSDIEQSFVPTDLTIVADHIFRSPVAEISYQRRPYSLIWGRRDDGRISCLSYNRQHEVLGWTQSIIGGTDAASKSIAVIPGNSDSSQVHASDERDELWMIVSRTVNSATVQYIEVMEYFFEGVLREDYDDEDDWQDAMRTTQQDAIYLDSAITYDSTSTTTVTGLTHLEGETVKVLADGNVQGDKIVSSASITLDSAASKVQIGLSYKHRYESLKLAVGASTAVGTSVNKAKIISGCGYVVLDTGEFKVTTAVYNEQGRRQHDLSSITFYQDGMDPSAALPVFTGEKNATLESSYSNDTRLYIESSEPLPFTILGLAPLLHGESRPSHA